MDKIEKVRKPRGYYWVKFYNHDIMKVVYYNGMNFEQFPSDGRINDEIESFEQIINPSKGA